MELKQISNVFGIIGASLLLAAYALDARKKIDHDSNVYAVMNFVGSMFIALSATLIGSFPIVGLNLAWAFISIRKL